MGDGIRTTGSVSANQGAARPAVRRPLFALEFFHSTEAVGNQPPRSNPDDYTLYLVRHGHQRIVAEKAVHEVEPGQALLVGPSVSHGHEAAVRLPGDLWVLQFRDPRKWGRGDVILDVGAALQRELQRIGGGCPFAASDELQAILPQLLAAQRNPAAFSDLLAESLLTVLAVRLVGEIDLAGSCGKARAGRRFSPVMRRATDFIDRELAMGISLEKVAKHCRMSTRQLRNHFVGELGCTPQEYLMRCRIKRAGNLLRQGLSATQVAYEVGLAGSAHFSTVFKRFTGMTPTRYRAIYERQDEKNKNR